MPSLDQWKSTWPGLGVPASAAIEREFEGLMARYAEPHRKYHTATHLDECFEKLAELQGTAEHPAEVELALWFHDAIYEERSAENEARSADLAETKAGAFRVSADSRQRIRRLIMATCHAAVPQGTDEQVLVDVDLAILGASPARFDEYEEQVRAEYSWAPEAFFKRERGKILKEFLARPTIFSTSLFQDRYESRARSNIERSVARLSQRE